MKLPTDRTVLECIFEMYQDLYPGSADASGRGANDPHVPIDVQAVAARLGCGAELLFGRLYYHLDHKYRYEGDDGMQVRLFTLGIGSKRHAVQFPYLASILAGLNLESRRAALPLIVSCVSVGVSLTALVVSIFNRHA